MKKKKKKKKQKKEKEKVAEMFEEKVNQFR